MAWYICNSRLCVFSTVLFLKIRNINSKHDLWLKNVASCNPDLNYFPTMVEYSSAAAHKQGNLHLQTPTLCGCLTEPTSAEIRSYRQARPPQRPPPVATALHVTACSKLLYLCTRSVFALRCTSCGFHVSRTTPLLVKADVMAKITRSRHHRTKLLSDNDIAVLGNSKNVVILLARNAFCATMRISYDQRRE